MEDELARTLPEGALVPAAMIITVGTGTPRGILCSFMGGHDAFGPESIPFATLSTTQRRLLAAELHKQGEYILGYPPTAYGKDTGSVRVALCWPLHQLSPKGSDEV